VKNLHAINMAFAVLSIPLSLLGQTGTKPVPDKWLHDGWLLVPAFNFSINSPSGDAKWSYKDDLPKVDEMVLLLSPLTWAMVTGIP
jgi:hypothetical protein